MNDEIKMSNCIKMNFVCSENNFDNVNKHLKIRLDKFALKK